LEVTFFFSLCYLSAGFVPIFLSLGDFFKEEYAPLFLEKLAAGFIDARRALIYFSIEWHPNPMPPYSFFSFD